MTGEGWKTTSRVWPYEFKLFHFTGRLLLHTRHKNKGSYDMEVSAARARGAIVKDLKE